MSFEVADYLINLKGKPYLPVAGRIAAIRSQHDSDQYSIETEALTINVEEGYAIFRATIRKNGIVLGTGTKYEDKRGFPDYIEKAETGAIGRAAAGSGFGTIYALEDFDEGERLADAPVHRIRQNPPAKPPSKPVDDRKREYKELARKAVNLAGLSNLEDAKVPQAVKELFREHLPQEASTREWPNEMDLDRMIDIFSGNA